MPIELPPKNTEIGTLVKKPNETVETYVAKIRFHCFYKSRVYYEKKWETPDHISALIVHCLPDQPPYTQIKNCFNDLHYDDGTPNYAVHGNTVGEWVPDWRTLTDIIRKKEHEYLWQTPGRNPYYHNPNVEESENNETNDTESQEPIESYMPMGEAQTEPVIPADETSTNVENPSPTVIQSMNLEANDDMEEDEPEEEMEEDPEQDPEEDIEIDDNVYIRVAIFYLLVIPCG